MPTSPLETRACFRERAEPGFGATRAHKKTPRGAGLPPPTYGRWGLSSGTTIGTYAVSVDSEGTGFSLRYNFHQKRREHFTRKYSAPWGVGRSATLYRVAERDSDRQTRCTAFREGEAQNEVGRSVPTNRVVSPSETLQSDRVPRNRNAALPG
jgi:hypothetical protein